MKKLLQINVSDSGSTGRIVEGLGNVWMKYGFETYAAFGRIVETGNSVITIGNKWDQSVHGLKTRLFDRHGFGSIGATNKLIKRIEEIGPDVIILQNLHGYYINIEILFKFIRTLSIPVIWALHDCWAFTGHCTYFDTVHCEKWKTGCFECPQKGEYPQSLLIDNSKSNYLKKKEILTSIRNLVLVTPSQWLLGLVKQSYLKDYRVVKINNGINIAAFTPTYSESVLKKYHIDGCRYIIGVAKIWEKRKGFDDFIKLSHLMDPDTKIVLVGLKKKMIKGLPSNVVGVPNTESMYELAELYTHADAFINPTWEDTFAITNAEALACGTPVITYNSGGSPEVVDAHTGFVVPKGDVDGILRAINEIRKKGKTYYTEACRERAVKYFNNEDRYLDYKLLYDEMMENNKTLIHHND